MRVCLGMPAIMSFPSRVCFQYCKPLLAVSNVFRSTRLLKHRVIDRISTSSGSSIPASGSYIQHSNYVTVSSACKFVQDRHVVHSLADSPDDNDVLEDDGPILGRDLLIKAAYTDIMIAPKRLTSDEWSAIGEKFQNRGYLANCWPTMLLHFIAGKIEAVPGLYSVGMSLVDYVKGGSHRCHLPLVVSAIAVCIHQGGESCHEQAFALYDELCTQYDAFDSDSARTLIVALAKTRRWRLCLELVDMVKITSDPSTLDYSPIIVAAMINNDKSLATELLVKLSDIGQMPSAEVFEYMMSNGGAEQVLTLLKEFGWIPSSDVVHSLVSHLHSHPLWTNQVIKRANMSKSGVCYQCGGFLEHQSYISDEEFDELRQEFMRRSLIRNGNIFLQTSPEELSSFNGFLSRHQSQPFTVVLDGLNIASGSGGKSFPQRIRSQRLQLAIDHFSHKGHRVLVFGRQHMKEWTVCKYCRDPSVHWSFTQNVSSDDPFMLYAALYFGRGTFIVTRDQLRDHRFVLGPKLASRLKQWQRQRQITFRAATNIKYRFEWPISYNTVVQQSADGWHVPFDDGQERASYSLPNAWFCIRNKSHR